MSEPRISGFDAKPYTPVLESPACEHCKKGEAWTVVGPTVISESWEGEEAQMEAIHRADELSEAYRAGIRAAIAAKRGV
jgi:hypothetical protein